MIINFEGLYKSYDGKNILNNIRGRVNSSDRIGLLGVNGVGKTTLAKILSGLEEQDSGFVSYSPEKIRVQYLSQNFNSLEMGSLNKEELEQARNIYFGLGLKEETLAQQFDTLSGGEKTKLMLLNSLTKDYDLLVLDEPTNHLDIESIKFLEGYLREINKSVLVISHDRYFLDKTVNKIWELSNMELKEYQGDYTNYRFQKEIERRNQVKEYEKQERQIQHLNEIINSRKEWFDKAHKAAGQNDFYRSKSKKHVSVLRSKEKELERIEQNKVIRPKEESSPCFHIINKSIINTKLPKYLVQVKELNKHFEDKVILKGASMDILRGDKAALIGKNGTGKTTLLKLINGIDKNFEGSISVNPSVKTAYFSQELEVLNSQVSILENVMDQCVTQAEARLLLANLFFRGDEVFKKVKKLSLGEQCRVAFAKLILSGANLLILDEPTNYMDIISKESIEEVLVGFKGSVIFVSHDRYFINRVANKILEIDNNKIESFYGNYEEYVEKRDKKIIDKDLEGEFKKLTDTVSKLECDIAFISGRFNEKLTEAEKDELNDKFLSIAKEIRCCKEKLAYFPNR